MSPFLAWGDFHARSRFARSTIPEEKWGTTRSLNEAFRGVFFREQERKLKINTELNVVLVLSVHLRLDACTIKKN